MSLLTNITNYYRLDNSGADIVGINPLSPTLVTFAPQYGVINSGAQFIGSGSILTAVSNTSLRTVTAFSVSCWAYSSVNNANQVLFNQFVSSSQALALGRVSNLQFQFFIANAVGDAGTNFISSAVGAFATNKWWHLVFVFDGTLTGSTNRARIYANGVLLTCTASGTIPAVTTAATSVFNVGCSVSNNSNLTGFIDEIGIWTRALTGSEVTSLYNSGLGSSYPFDGSIIPQYSTAQFCNWLLVSTYYRFTNPRRAVLTAIKTAALAGTVVTQHDWNQFINIAAPFYSLYIAQVTLKQ